MLVGTVGHVDHGKTTLVRALTGTDCDRLSEEKRRGITIELGFAKWVLPSGRAVGVVDVPGHEKLVRAMLVGAGGMDAVVLCLSAAAGVMPQTREHLAACQVLGVHRGVVALTFSDRVEDLDAAVAAARSGLAGTVLAEAPIVPVCALDGTGLDTLAQAVDRIEIVDTARGEAPALLPVDRVFSIDGHGTVVTGTLVRGQVRKGDVLELVPGGKTVRVRGLQSHGKPISAAGPGTRVAINLATPRETVVRGAYLTAPERLATTRVFDVQLDWLAHNAKPFSRQRALSIHLGASRAVADVRADGSIEPGETGTARIRLDRPLPVPVGARFALRGPSTYTHGAVVGGGLVLDPMPPRGRRVAARERLCLGDERDAEALYLEEAKARGLSPQVLRLRTLAEVPDGPTRFSPAALSGATARVLEAVTAYHLDRPFERLMPVARLGVEPLKRLALDVCLADGGLVREGGGLRIPTHTGGLDKQGQALSRKLMRAIGGAGLRALRFKTLDARFPASAERLKEVLSHLERTGRVGRVESFYFPARELFELRRRVAQAALSGEALSIGWLKASAGLSRLHAIPLFNWLDGQGTTRRRGDVRIAGPRAEEHAHG